MRLSPEEIESFEYIKNWNERNHEWWESLTDDERRKLTTFNRDQWKKKTAGIRLRHQSRTIEQLHEPEDDDA